jgi:hypothetical protein
VHDINNLDQRGVPGIFIASTEFIEAAEAQAKALGFAPASVFIQHPIQDRTDDEVNALADGALEMILAKISQ